MRITVFGATGRIGRIIIRRALENGDQVVAYVRRNALNINDDNLTIVKGELNDESQILKAVTGTDGVICILGNFHHDGIPEAHETILKMMEKASVSRFVTLMTPCVKHEKDSFSMVTFFPNFWAGFFFKEGKKGVRRAGEYVKASPLDWTIVRHCAPKDTPYTGNIKIGFGRPIGEMGQKKMKMAISREDIAAFMLEQLTDLTYNQSMPIIGT